MNPNVDTTVAKIRDFSRMNPLEFHGSNFYHDPKEFIDEFNKRVGIMGFSMVQKVEFDTNPLKGVSQVRLEQWKINREVDMGPLY